MRSSSNVVWPGAWEANRETRRARTTERRDIASLPPDPCRAQCPAPQASHRPRRTQALSRAVQEIAVQRARRMCVHVFVSAYVIPGTALVNDVDATEN